MALGDGLYPGEVRPAFTRTLSIALWRDFDGAAHAMHTRCPHRGMNLAHGFVREQHLACAYHGWQYDSAGQCVYIPAHPQLPPARSICATVYGCVEVGGVVFVREENAAHDLPVTPPFDTTAVRTVTIEAALPLVHERLDANADETWIRPRSEPEIVCAVQALPASRSAVHVLLNHNDASNESKLAAAGWACQFRDACEVTAEGSA